MLRLLKRYWVNDPIKYALDNNNEILLDKNEHVKIKNIPCHCKNCTCKREFVSNLPEETIKALREMDKEVTFVYYRGNDTSCLICGEHNVTLYRCKRCSKAMCYYCNFRNEIHSNNKCLDTFGKEIKLIHPGVINKLKYIKRDVGNYCPEIKFTTWLETPKLY